VLFYILFRLLTGAKKKVKNSGGGGSESHDVLVEDPVCKVCVPKKQALTEEEDGKIFYFCSAECREKFIARKGE
jgi:YHS domain-containing protein